MNKTKPEHASGDPEESLGRWLAPRLGQRIALRRHERGWTQAVLAEKLNIEVETISRFERGHVLPSLKRLAYIAETLDVSMSDLVGAASSLPADVALDLQDLLSATTPQQSRALVAAMRLIVAEMVNQ